MDASIGLGFSLELLKKRRENGLLQAFVPRLPGVSGKCHVEVTILQGDVVSCRAQNQQGHIHTVNINLLLKLDEIRGPFAWQLFPLAQGDKRATSTTQPFPPSLSERESGSGIRPLPGSTTQPLSSSLSERESGSGIRPLPGRTTWPLPSSLFERESNSDTRAITGRTTRPLSPSLLGRFEQRNLQANRSSNSPIPYVTAQLGFSQTVSWTPNQKQALITIYSLVDGNRSIDDIKQVVPFSSRLVEEILQVLVWLGVVAISSPPNNT